VRGSDGLSPYNWKAIFALVLAFTLMNVNRNLTAVALHLSINTIFEYSIQSPLERAKELPSKGFLGIV